MAHNQSLLDTASACLNNAPCSFEWGDIASYLINKCPSLPDAVRHWISKYSLNQHICYALSQALQYNYCEFESIAISWACCCHTSPYSNYILEPLLKNRSNDIEVIHWCHIWLNIGEGEKSYILESLLKHKPVSLTTINIAVDWLNEVTPEHGTWIYIWKALLNVKVEDNLDLFILYDSNRKIWPYIWLAQIKISPNTELYDLGKLWVMENDFNHPAWMLLWMSIYKFNENDQDIINMGQEYVKEVNYDNELWAYSFMALSVLGYNFEQNIPFVKILDLNG